jgi:hypothetical protein
MQLKTKAGLALVALGIGILGAWNWWTKTRNFTPLNVSLPLTVGQSISPEFKINYDALYLIEVEAQKTLASETLHCLLGLEADLARCKELPPPIALNWALTNKNQAIKHGSSAEQHTVPPETNTVSRVIGEFQGKAGQEYQLRVAITGDGTPLASAHPHLKIAVASIVHTDLQSENILVISIVSMCLLFGTILLGIAIYAMYAPRSV